MSSPSTWVFQLRPLARTWERSRISGERAATPATSRRMASASSRVRLLAEPQPPRMPPVVMLPGKTLMRFWPRLAMEASTWALAPLPMLTMAMTAATPMMMPRAVRIERRALRRSARRATLMMLAKRIGGF
jgi:hypothetical protein